MPEKSTPSARPVEELTPPKTVWSKVAPVRSVFWNDTEERFTPEKLSESPVRLDRTALVPEKSTPSVTPVEELTPPKTVWSKVAPVRSVFWNDTEERFTPEKLSESPVRLDRTALVPEKSTPSVTPVEELNPPKTVWSKVAPDRSVFWNDTEERFTPEKLSESPVRLDRTALVPEKSTPSVTPVEELNPPKTVWSKVAPDRSVFWKDTEARFTPVKSMAPLMS